MALFISKSPNRMAMEPVSGERAAEHPVRRRFCVLDTIVPKPADISAQGRSHGLGKRRRRLR
jgi:hypothetical protein